MRQITVKYAGECKKLGWSRYIADQEDNATASCRDCAIKNGHTTEEADNCDDGSVGCPDCPFPALGK